MKLEQQVSSLQLSKKLKELGVEQDSLFWWIEGTNGDFSLEAESNFMGQPKNPVSAFTVAELGEMLPSVVIKDGTEYNIAFVKHRTGKPFYVTLIKAPVSKDSLNDIEADTEADARAKMLIYLIKNNLI